VSAHYSIKSIITRLRVVLFIYLSDRTYRFYYNIFGIIRSLDECISRGNYDNIVYSNFNHIYLIRIKQNYVRIRELRKILINLFLIKTTKYLCVR